MKPLLFNLAVLFLLCCYGSLFGQGTGYVRLEGKQFIDHTGNPFYPLLVNWGALIKTDGVNYYPAAYPHYGPTMYFECQNEPFCRQQILNQFNNIRALGFNGIRLSGLFPELNPATGDYIFNVYDQNVNKSTKDVSNPSELNILLNAYSELLDIAADVTVQPFYIIINTGGQSNTDGLGNTVFSWSTFQTRYSNFLIQLGQHLQSEPLLLAYDLYNEPCYHISMNTSGVEKKEEACNLVSGWVDAIRTFDQYHLTTIGNCWDETMRFDPACLKIDFNSPHFYPFYSLYGNTTQDQNQYFQNQVEGILHWLGKNMPVPWIIGETGFRAFDAVIPPPSWQDHFNGTEAEQANYAAAAVSRTRDCGASGFSWWNYQDYFWFGNNTSERGENYFGLLKRDIPTCPDPLDPCSDMYKTPVTTFFSNYGNSPLPPINSTNCTAPANYLDPFNHETMNTSGTGEITGTVTDQDGNPIGDALVYGWGWLETETINNNDYFSHYPFYTFTNSDPVNFPLAVGEFKIRPYNYLSPTVTNYQKLVHIWFTGLGLENKNYGNWEDDQLTQNSFTESLRRINFGYNGIANNQTVSSSQRNLRGGESLLVENSTITASGTSEITAQKKIYLKNFRAEAGSYVHIYPANYDHCVSYDGLRIINPFGDSNSGFNENRNNELILNFNTSSRIVISPNPANDFIDVQLKGFQEGVIVKIFTSEGREIGNYSISDPISTKINTNGYNNGMYIIVATDQLNQQTAKFIIAH